MERDNNILFLTLRIFSATGGIEKVCKVICKALQEITTEQATGTGLKVLSMYDNQDEPDDKYISPALFNGYNQQKIKFISNAILQGRKSKVVVLSHINLLSIGFLIKLVSPKTKLVLLAHGIEVWEPLSFYRKKMIKYCDLILAVSEFTKNKMIEYSGVEREKISVFNNCIDPYLAVPAIKGKDPALQKKYGFTNDNIVLMTLTRLSSKDLYKGYDHVLYSINSLKEKYPAIKYLIVGRYDEQEKRRLDDIIGHCALKDFVVFTGYIQDEELAGHYGLADIYVMPSKKEGFGIVFIEAMHYGLPVIAGNKDGSTDALCNGKLGILVNPDEQLEINGAIEKIINHKESYKPDQDLLKKCFSFQSYKENLRYILNSLSALSAAGIYFNYSIYFF